MARFESSDQSFDNLIICFLRCLFVTGSHCTYFVVKSQESEMIWIRWIVQFHIASSSNGERKRPQCESMKYRFSRLSRFAFSIQIAWNIMRALWGENLNIAKRKMFVIKKLRWQITPATPSFKCFSMELSKMNRKRSEVSLYPSWIDSHMRIVFSGYAKSKIADLLFSDT